MLINFSGQIINDFFIPSFTLSKGEIVIINVPGGALFRPTIEELTKIFIGDVSNDNIEINPLLKFVEHLKEGSFKDRFFPMTVGRYHHKFANQSNPIYKKIYDIAWITPNIKINTLGGKARKLLSLYTSLSWTNYIISDLIGLDPQSGEEVYDLMKEIAKSGGAVMVFDFSDEFKDECTRFIKARHVGDKC